MKVDFLDCGPYTNHHLKLMKYYGLSVGDVYHALASHCAITKLCCNVFIVEAIPNKVTRTTSILCKT